jgi:hypothetical protein
MIFSNALIKANYLILQHKSFRKVYYDFGDNPLGLLRILYNIMILSKPVVNVGHPIFPPVKEKINNLQFS